MERKNYTQDETGQWWYQPLGRPRCRAYEQNCKQCRGIFLSHHKHIFCSRSCLGASQKGVLRVKRVPRKCEWCGKEFIPSRKTKKCCSLRCAYDLGNTKRGRKGELNPRWKGGVRPLGSTGYIRQYVPGRGYLLQHRLIMGQILGRPLQRYEEVHHKNTIRSDNRLENLELWIKRQPGGGKVEDLLKYAHWIIDTYGKLE